MVLVLAILSLERWGRRGTVFVGDQRPADPVALTGMRAWGACLCCALPVLGGFALPASYLLAAATERLATRGLPVGLLDWAANSAWYAAWATIMTVVLGLCLAFTARQGRFWLLRLGSAGYAMPGAVAAVGLMVALGRVDDGLDLVVTALAGVVSPLVFLGSGAALVIAYIVRFLAIPAGGLDAAYARLDGDYDNAARGLGCSDHRLLFRVHAPLLRAPLLMAGLLVFVDAMKELPATLLLRPTNVETLATTLYGEAVRGTYEDGAVAAMALIAIAVLPAALLAWLQDSRRGLTRLGMPRHRRVATAQAPAAE
jgi:iron(III) transport system permease protein